MCSKARWAQRVKVTSAVPTSKQKQGYEAFALWDIEELQRDHLGRLIGPGDVLLNSATKDLEITDRGHRKIFEELRKIGRAHV